MMLYEEHYKLLKEFKDLDRSYNKILEKKIMIVLKVQPGAVDTTKDLVDGTRISNDKFTMFVQNLEKIEPDLQYAKNERDTKQYFLKKKEMELRQSKETMDKIYVCRFIDRMKVRYIPSRINYGRSRTYDLLKEIEEKLNIG